MTPLPARYVPWSDIEGEVNRRYPKCDDPAGVEMRAEFLACYSKSLHAAASRPLPSEVREEHFLTAAKEFFAFVQLVKAKGATLHDLAMWLQTDGFRLRNLKAAYLIWNSLCERDA